jgi:hypothetical protein
MDAELGRADRHQHVAVSIVGVVRLKAVLAGGFGLSCSWLRSAKGAKYDNQGRRASLRSSLAPGYHISRLWRCIDRLLTF